MHVRFVLHGGKPEPAGLREALARRRTDVPGDELDVQVTFEAGDARRVAREAAQLHVDGVVVLGGDGSLNEVVRGVLEAGGGHRPWIGVAPLGTANDFAGAAGVPVSIPEAIEQALEAPAVPVDVLRCGEHLALNTITGGSPSSITAETPEPLKTLLGRWAYVLTGLRSPAGMEARELAFQGPEFHWEGRVLAFGLGNGRTAGGGVPVAPEAQVDDGLLDMAVLPRQQEELGELLESFLETGFPGMHELAIRHRTPWVEIESRDGAPLDLSLDGEPVHVEAGAVRVEVDAGAVRLRLPEGSPLLG